MKRLIVLGIVTTVSGCVGPLRNGTQTTFITPEQAVMAAAEAAPRAIPGTFLLTVRGVGFQDGHYYLNSEADYRDQRNLTIDIPTSVERQLEERLGKDPLEHFGGKMVLVSGAAERVRIDFTNADRPTGKYYYQTHVRIAYPEQIRLAPR